jgi:3-oxoacyl-[acyl-carrier protein] reductase
MNTGVNLDGPTLEGAVAVITGGAGGLGSASARRLAAAGAHVVVADVDVEALANATDELQASGASVDGVVLDVTDADAVEAAMRGIADRHARLDVVVTCHGFPRDRALLDMTDDVWSDVVDVCLTGTFNCVRAGARMMVHRKYGRIVTIASRAWYGNPGQANYSAAKAGVIGLTRSVAKELGRHGVTVNALSPGLIDTASLRRLSTYDAIAERAIKQSSIKRLGSPDDVAAAVAFLASPDAGFITGEVIHVSGGRLG